MIFSRRTFDDLGQIKAIHTSPKFDFIFQHFAKNAGEGRKLRFRLAYELGNIEDIVRLMPAHLAPSFLKTKPSYFINNEDNFIVDVYPELNDKLRKHYRERFTKLVRDDHTEKAFDSAFEDVTEKEHVCKSVAHDDPIIGSMISHEIRQACYFVGYFDKKKKIGFADACQLCCAKSFKKIVDEGRFFLPSIRPFFIEDKHMPRRISLLTIMSRKNYVPYILAYYARESLFNRAMESKMYDLAEAIAFRYIGMMPLEQIQRLKDISGFYDVFMAFKDTSENS